MQTRSSNSPPILQAGLGDNVTKAHWSVEEEAFFLERLLEAKAVAPQGFKEPVFRAAADALNKRALENNSRQGAEKSHTSCKTKWTNVCIPSIHVLTVS